MTVSPSSSAQRARQALVGRLRELRLDAGLTARALSAAAGWHEAKTSRIESAKQAPSEADIVVWCRVCAAQDEAPNLIAASRAADSMYVEWRRVHRTGLRHAQVSRLPLYQRTRVFKMYCSSVVPGFLQAPGYARALLSVIAAFRETPNDVDEAVDARMDRNQILHAAGHRFMIVVEESVLRYRLGSSEDMAIQLEHFLGSLGLPTVSLGVIPFAVHGRDVWPLETFVIFDDNRVHVELLSAQVTVTAPSETSLYVRAFDMLAQLAVYGPQARDLIMAAISEL